jgi:hypothetical protein
MAKLKIANNPEVDPTLPKVQLTLGGETYFLCFTFGALALAEAKLRANGIECNMLHALDLSSLDANRVVPLLYAAMITHDPAIKFENVAALVTLRNLGSIFEGITAAYAASLADPADEAGKAEPDEATS